MIDTKRIRAYCEKATPGKWVKGDKSSAVRCCVFIERYHGLTIYAGTEDDADFIAQARTDLPALVDELEALREAASEVLRTSASSTPSLACSRARTRLRALLAGGDDG